MPAAARSPAAPATARLSDCAPCDPPNTSSTLASSEKPKCARASARSDVRSSDVIASTDGHADDLDVPQTGLRHCGQHALGPAGSDLVGPARAGVGLVHDHGHPVPSEGTTARREVGG